MGSQIIIYQAEDGKTKGELDSGVTIKEFLIVQQEGNRGKPCGAKHLANILRHFHLTFKRLEDLAHACAILNWFHISLPASTCLISLPKKNWLPRSNARNFSLNSSGDYEIGL